MKDCTYYDLLGISSSATEAEIVAAKNFLVKKFHPDSNMDTTFDTTTYIQNVLFAYRILSDPKKRRGYDRHLESLSLRSGKGARPKRNAPLSPDFTPYWEASNKLNDLVKKSSAIIAEGNAEKRKGFKLPIRKDKEQIPEHDGRLSKLAREAAMHSFWHRTVPPATKGLLLFSSSFMSDSATLQTVARQPMFIEFSRQEH